MNAHQRRRSPGQRARLVEQQHPAAGQLLKYLPTLDNHAAGLPARRRR